MGRRRKKRLFKKARKKKFKLHIDLERVRAALVWIFKIGAVCFLAFVLVWYFGQQISTVGDSMNPVLKNGDVVLVDRLIYNAMAPRRGDIIVFKPKGNENVHYYTKRIIGLPGEDIEIIENRIYIDGVKLDEEYKTTDIDDVGIVDEKIRLAEDEYFVLGDNRVSSEDSRNADVGNVKREYIYGKAWFVLSPREDFGWIKK
ncbi:MAG: signal peptidase I [Lachnospiraceae bacterium]|nr:signal peptidase I [Dorea sp.]MDE7038945.1 signal peptidase I [Lachnospiraceae bacterium]